MIYGKQISLTCNLIPKKSQFKYILTIIDAFSKYAQAYPLKNKNKENVSQAFKTILEEGRIPKNLQTDLGTEFYNSNLKKIINHYSNYSIKKASIVGRFIRTLKWINVISNNLLKEYNSTYHRTMELARNKVNENNKNEILKRCHTAQLSPQLRKHQKFKIGDYVRISKYKGTFEKGYTPNWSSEIFKVHNIRNTNPVTYLLNDVRQRPILGAFYTEELQRTQHPNIYLIEKF